MNAETFYIETHGCQMNIYDSAFVSEVLAAAGYRQTADPADAGIILINTCSVRARAERKALSRAYELGSRRGSDPGPVIGIIGCMAQRLGRDLLEPAGRIDLVAGPDTYARLPALLKTLRARREPLVDTARNREAMYRLTPAAHEGVTAFVTIMRGCNNFCSYCVVPYVRGPERSKPHGEIIDEVKHLVDLGVREVTLIGQNVNSYGRGLDESTDFADLLALVDSIDGIKRIRFATSHPKDLSIRLIDTMASLNHVCEHLHLPMQSGSNSILDFMNRQYTISQFESLVDKLRDAMPGIGLTTDIIVGFPGETDIDFEATCAAVQRIRFDGAYIFKYSDRPGTPAATMQGHVNQNIIEERHAHLLDLQKTISAQRVHGMIGKRWELLAESSYRANGMDMLKGRTRNYKVGTTPGSPDRVGSELPVQVTGLRGYTLECETVTG